MMMTRRVVLMAGCLCCFLAAASAAEAWKNINREANPELPGNEIQFLEAGRDGQVWIGTLSGLGTYKDGTVATVLPEIQAWDVLQVNGTTFVGHAKGVTVLSGGAKEEHLNGYTVAPLVRVKAGLLWAIGKNRGTEENHLFAYDGTAWAEVEAYKGRRVVDLLQTRKGKLWLTVDGDGVLEVDPEGNLDEPTPHLQGMNVTTISEDGRGHIWCGLWGRGVAAWNGVNWTQYLTKEKESAVLAICQDSKSNMWAATSAKGVFFKPFNEETWTNLLAEEGAINTLAATGDGRVYVSSQMRGGLRYWNGTEFVVSLASPLPIRCVLHLKDGTTLAGGVLDGLHVRKAGP